MAPRSTASSEPLSSPSPSPPPKMSSTAPTSSNARPNAATTSTVAALKTTATMEDSSDLSELTDEDDDRVRSKPTSATKRTRRRGALIPENMWDWAYKKKPSTSRSVSAQRRDTSHADDDEEEEDEEENEDDENGDGDKSDDGEEDEEKLGGPDAHDDEPGEVDEDDEEEDGEVKLPPSKPSLPSHRRVPSKSATPSNQRRDGRRRVVYDSDEDLEPGEEEDDSDSREEGEIDDDWELEDSRLPSQSHARRARRVDDDEMAEQAATRDEDVDEEENDMDIEETTKADDPLAHDDEEDDHDPPESEEEGAIDEEEEDVPLRARASPSTRRKPSSSGDPTSVSDPLHPSALASDPLAAKDSASRPNPTSTRALPDPKTAHPDDSLDVEEEEEDQEDEEDDEDDADPNATEPDGTTTASRIRAFDDAEVAALDTLGTLAGTTLALAEEVAAGTIDAVAQAEDADASGLALVDAEVEVDDAAAAAAADEDGDVDVEVEAEVEAVVEEEDEEEEQDTLEADTDLQPPQRAEALDILAGLEVKFAILRERIYLDKMQEVADEEAMILNNTHPELLHFMSTLEQRKERRISLASLRRERDQEWIRRKRKASDDAVWSWWRVQKDSLQDDMVSEVNGKRRKLEREKRSLDHRVNVRNPWIPPGTQLPESESLKSIMKKYQRPPSSIEFDANVTLPSLPSLSIMEIGSDIEAILDEQRRQQQLSNMQMGFPPIDAFNGMNGDYAMMDSAPFGGFPPVNSHPQHQAPPPPPPAVLVPAPSQNHRHAQSSLPSLTPFRNAPPNGSALPVPSGHPIDPYQSSPIISAPTHRQFAPSPAPYDHPPPRQHQLTSRKRSPSPPRHSLPHVNGWDDVPPPHALPPSQHSARDAYPAPRKSTKLPRVGPDSGVLPPPSASPMDGHPGHMDEWGPAHGRIPSPSIPSSIGRTQLPPPRSLHRSSGSGLPPLGGYGAPTSVHHLDTMTRDPHLERERERERSRERHLPYHDYSPYPPPSAIPDRPHLPSPAALVSEAGLAPWDVLPPPGSSRNGSGGGHGPGSSYWTNGAGSGRRDRERVDREREREYRDDSMYPGRSPHLDPPRPQSQPQSVGGRPSSPTQYRTLPPHPTSSAGSRRTPLPPPPGSSHGQHPGPTSPALSQASHTSKSKPGAGGMSPIHSRLPPPMTASRSGSPPPARPLSSLGGSPSILAPHPHPAPARPKSIVGNTLPIFPLPPISSSASYANGAMSMSGSMFSNPAPAPSNTPGAGSNGMSAPSSVSPSPGLAMGGSSSANKSARPPAVPVE